MDRQAEKTETGTKLDVGKVSGVAVAIVRKKGTDEFVLVKNVAHPDPLSKLPGGTVESEEEGMDAVSREILQETGLGGDPIYLHKHWNAKRNHWFWCYYVEVPGFKKLLREAVEDGEERILPHVMSYEEIKDSKKILKIHKDIFLEGVRILRETGMY